MTEPLDLFTKLERKHPHVDRRGLPRIKREWEGEKVAVRYMISRGHAYKRTSIGWKFGTLEKMERDDQIGVRDKDGKLHSIHYTRVTTVFNTQRYNRKEK